MTFKLSFFFFILSAPLFAQSPDPHFGTNGIVKSNLSGGIDTGEVITLQGSKIIVAGNASDKKNSTIGVMRYLSTGEVDTTFGINGQTILPIGSEAHVYGLGIQRSGKIILAGTAKIGNRFQIAIARLDSNGNPDKTFGREGTTLVPFYGDAEAHYLAIDKNDTIVVAGYVSMKRHESDFIIVRFNADGFLDPEFAEAGITRLHLSSDDKFYGLALQSNSRIVATGSIRNPETGNDCVVMRYLPNGALDKSFGNKGKTIISFSKKQDACSSVTVDNRSQEIIVAGFSEGDKQNIDFAAAKLDFDGAIDSSFGNKGQFIFDVKGARDVVHAIGILPGNRIVLGGEADTPKTKSTRHQTNMAWVILDGKKPIAETLPNAMANALTVTPEGKVLLTGHDFKDWMTVQIAGVSPLP